MFFLQDSYRFNSYVSFHPVHIALKQEWSPSFNESIPSLNLTEVCLYPGRGEKEQCVIYKSIN